MIVFTEADPPQDGGYEHLDHISDMHRMAMEFARCGWEVVHIPKEYACADDLEAVFSGVTERAEPTRALWSGYVPSQAHYEAVYRHLQQKNIYLPNPPEAHQEIMELDRSLRCLGELTAESVVIERESATSEQAPTFEDVVARLGLPLFLKGAVFSQKDEGWGGCVATTLAELREKVERFPTRLSRGRVIARKLLPLKKNGETLGGFPIAREFRFFLWRGEILAYGFYWAFGDTAFITLSPEEEKQVLALVQEAARRFQAAYLKLDVGQTEDGVWWVIESGDPQFAGLSHIPMETLIERLTLSMREPPPVSIGFHHEKDDRT